MILHVDSYRGTAVWIQRDTQQFSPNENIRGCSPIAADIFYLITAAQSSPTICQVLLDFPVRPVIHRHARVSLGMRKSKPDRDSRNALSAARTDVKCEDGQPVLWLRRKDLPRIAFRM
jgi:hypothetical protein